MKNKMTLSDYEKKVLNTPKKRKEYEAELINAEREAEFAKIAAELAECVESLCDVTDMQAIFDARIILKRYKDFVK